MGDWNTWQLPGHQLEFDHQSGIWTGFIPTIGHGATYKYAVVSRSDGVTTLKADPFAFASELRPSTASRIWGPSAEPWNDGPWVASRPYVQAPNRPISIYECHLGSWQRSPETPKLPLGYRELARQLAPYLKHLGYTHVELLPVTEYPLDESWGYQVTGYFAPTARYGTPDDFRFFVDYLHQNGIGVILDWVPGHFCKDQHGLGRFDGTALFEHGSRVRGEHPVWGTYQFDFGRPEVRTFLLASALYWLEVFHIDGLRVDAVASMVWLDHGRPHDHWEPNAWGRTDHPEAVDFLRRLNRLVHREVPGALMFAEEATTYEWVTRRDPISGRSGTRTPGSDGPRIGSRDCERFLRTNMATPVRSCFSWDPNSASGGNGTRVAASIGTFSSSREPVAPKLPFTGACRIWCAPSIESTKPTVRCTSSTRIPTGSGGSRRKPHRRAS
ncbi:MAG: hypothetical protein EBT22_05230 [Chloroflexi bacterium]|nr:hypothetical protein [Chloroflexota bacterium]